MGMTARSVGRGHRHVHWWDVAPWFAVAAVVAAGALAAGGVTF